ncbi:hypothetical protein [Streptomyces sp. WAC00276]
MGSPKKYPQADSLAEYLKNARR